MNRSRMTSVNHALTLTITACSILFAAACGDSMSSANPVAPSAVVTDSQNQEVSAADGEFATTAKGGNGKGGGNKDTGNASGNSGGGNGNSNSGGGNGNGKGNSGGGQPSVQTPTQGSTNTTPTTTTGKVELEGVIEAKTGDGITVRGQQVTVPESCVIRHGNTFYTLGDLSVGDRVHVKGRRLTSGTGTLATTTIEATEVKLQNPGAPSGDDDDDGDDDDGDDDDDDSTGASVSVSAFDANAAETGGDLGTFRFTRTGSTVSALTVTFTVSGTATAGTDYQSLPVSVTIAAGATTADLFVIALPDGATEGTETVIVTVSDGASYNVGAVSATVNIAG